MPRKPKPAGPEPAALDKARRARLQKKLAERDYRLAIREMKRGGHSQTQIAKWLGVTQPAVSQVLSLAPDEAPPLEGFSGATAYEICERYAAGELSRARVVDELTRFPYVPEQPLDGVATGPATGPGTRAEVLRAREAHLIGADVYDEVLRALASGPR